jgi:hypothetical protein
MVNLSYDEWQLPHHMTPSPLKSINDVINYFSHCPHHWYYYFGPQGKRKFGPPPPILHIMIHKLSPPRCVISKEESVQQKWIDELWFRKQLSTCLNSWAPGSRPGWHPLSVGLIIGRIRYMYTLTSRVVEWAISVERHVRNLPAISRWENVTLTSCLTPTQQFFSYIMARTNQFSMRWWWGPLCTNPTHFVGFL